MILPDGSYYHGYTQKNHLTGQGLLINPNGDYYLGRFINSMADGKGIYCSSEFKYEGEFKKNLMWGFGTLTENDSCFIGTFEKGKKKKGKLIKQKEGSIY